MIRTPMGTMVDGRHFWTPSMTAAGAGDQTDAVQAALDYAAQQEFMGLLLPQGATRVSGQLLVKNTAGFIIQGRGAQITGVGNATGGGGVILHSTGTRLLWNSADATKAMFLFSDLRGCLFQDFGFHVDVTTSELLSCFDVMANTAEGVNTPTGNRFRRLSANGGNIVNGHVGIHFFLRMVGPSSYMAPANAGNANNDYVAAEDCELNCIQVAFSLDADQQKMVTIDRCRMYGAPWNQLTEQASDANFGAKTKAFLAAGAIYNPATDTWSAPASGVGGNAHVTRYGASRCTVGDFVLGPMSADGMEVVGGNAESSARLVARMPGQIAANIVAPLTLRHIRWAHAGYIASDYRYIDFPFGGPLTMEQCVIDDSDLVPTAAGSGVANTGVYHPLVAHVEPPSVTFSKVHFANNTISTTSDDLVVTSGSNPRRIEVTGHTNRRRDRTDGSYYSFHDRHFDSDFNNEFVDDFDNGIPTTGSIGNGWTASSTSHISIPNSEANHPGIVRLTTTATSGTFGFLRLSTGSGGAVFLPTERFTLNWIFRLNQNDANETMRLGVMTPSASAPTSGMYLEKLDADTNWFFVCNNGGVQTRTDSGIAVDTAWHRLRIRRLSGPAIGFTLDNNAEVSIASNLTANLLYAASQIVNSAAAAKTIDHDKYQQRFTHLVR